MNEMSLHETSYFARITYRSVKMFIKKPPIPKIARDERYKPSRGTTHISVQTVREHPLKSVTWIDGKGY